VYYSLYVGDGIIWLWKGYLQEDTWNEYEPDYEGGDRWFKVKVEYSTPWLCWGSHGFDYIQYMMYG